MARLRRQIALPEDTGWQDLTLAYRPFPADGLPVAGALDNGPYVCVMHSGMTLAAIVADLATADILGQQGNREALLAPYRPQHFVQP